MHLLPISLLVFLPASVLVWGQTLIPPSTFPTLPSSSTSGSTTTSASQSQSSSVNVSLTASSTSTASFPSLSGYSPCVSNCLAVGIARVGCSSVVDVNCFCVSPGFPLELVGCIVAECPSELLTAESLAQQFCNIASASPTLSFPPVPTITSSSSSTSSEPSTATNTAPSATNTTNTAAHSRNAGEVAWMAVGLSILLGLITRG